jgi:4-diphosphocytidyl-2-C-methyl-D-erythritol kinase
MQSVSLADTITLTEVPSGIQLTTTNLRLPTDRKNLAYKAAELFFESQKLKVKSQNKGIKIYLEKNIPLAAGLAGGSADAAAVLFGLNQLIAPALRVTHYALLELGAEIGSDVPFCLVGGNCTVTGRGEKVARNPLNTNRYFVLVTPDVEVPTKWAYAEWDEENSKSKSQKSKLSSNNDLEEVVIRKYPVIQKVKERLLELGCRYAQMSGSGPTVFGIVPDQAAGERIAAEMKKEYSRSYAVRSVDSGVATLS